MMKKLLSVFLGITFVIAPLSASALVIPTGRATSGDLAISSGTTTDNTVESNITVSSAAGIASTTVASVTGFAAGQYVMLYQTYGTGAGGYEFQQIRSVSGNSLFFYGTLANTYQATGAQVIKVSEYHNVTLSGGTWTGQSWNGTRGGVLVAFLTGSLSMSGGTISQGGFGGGGGCPQFGCSTANQGDGTGAGAGSASNGANGDGAGGGTTLPNCTGGQGGGGGGNGAAGSGGGGFCSGGSGSGGTAGAAAGSATLSTIVIGGGGGGGACTTASCTGGSGGSGAGVIILISASSTISGGTFTLNGSGGSACSASGGAGGGGGAGGSIRLPARLNLTLGSSITATAGSGGTTNCNGGGGNGATGRIGTVSAVTVSGTTNPTINTSSTDFVYNVDDVATQVNLGSVL